MHAHTHEHTHMDTHTYTHTHIHTHTHTHTHNLLKTVDLKTTKSAIVLKNREMKVERSTKKEEVGAA